MIALVLKPVVIVNPQRRLNPRGFLNRWSGIPPVRMGWARLLERVFGIDIEHCPQCGGDLKIIAAIEEPAVIVKILTHLGLPARSPLRSREAVGVRRFGMM